MRLIVTIQAVSGIHHAEYSSPMVQHRHVFMIRFSRVNLCAKAERDMGLRSKGWLARWIGGL